MTTYSVQTKRFVSLKIEKCEGEVIFQDQRITKFHSHYDWDYVRDKFSPDVVAIIKD